jgi:hypothetical protein
VKWIHVVAGARGRISRCARDQSVPRPGVRRCAVRSPLALITCSACDDRLHDRNIYLNLLAAHSLALRIRAVMPSRVATPAALAPILFFVDISSASAGLMVLGTDDAVLRRHLA